MTRPRENRFKKTSRIRKSREYLEVKKRGKKVRCGALLISFVPKETRRLGMIVPSGAGNAVERNRIKRVIRELFRTEQEIFPKGDIVVIALPGAAKMDNQKIRLSLRGALATKQSPDEKN